MASPARNAAVPDPLDQAILRLQKMLPAPPGRVFGWLHSPKSRLFRIPIGILCIVASFFWFLPVVGLEFLPIGLLLIAQDVPVLRAPVGKLVLRLLDFVERVARWWKTRRD